jgi:hypothetical protein
LSGRPYPLKGRFFANIFIHFKPKVSPENGKFPKYIVPNNTAAERWFMEKGQDDMDMPREEEPSFEEESMDSSESFGRESVHYAAMEGDLDSLRQLVEAESGEVLNYPDENGWTALHEAARSLNLDVVKFMVENGADAHLKTAGDESTALDLAIHYGGTDHPVVHYLRPLFQNFDEL